MLAKVNSCIIQGVDGYPLDVEVDISRGLPMFSTVGLPDGAVRESKDRVKAAIKNSGYDFPNRKITVNLAPADVRKEGAGFDLPIALGILAASELLPVEVLADYVILGELSLDGGVRGVRGVLPMVAAARSCGMKGVMVPYENRNEAAVVDGVEVIPISFLYEAVEYLLKKRDIIPFRCEIKKSICAAENQLQNGLDFADVKGQEHAKRAFEIAAAGNHNVIMRGPPGAGKTMLAQRLPSILPDMSFDEALEVTKVASISGLLNGESRLIEKRPFRAPHHTISDAGLIGGGSYPKPGEVSLAHNGVLFLDELTEFKKRLLEMLRQPLEEKTVTISRAAMSLCYPADFLLVAAYNPCPCGYLGDKTGRCQCTSVQIERYCAKLSGPLLDRVDIHIELGSLNFDELSGDRRGESSLQIKSRVNRARKRQQDRFRDLPGMRSNAMMQAAMVEKFCVIDHDTRSLMQKSVEKLGLSARGFHRVLKLARTIADLDEKECIEKHHVAEAMQYRGR